MARIPASKPSMQIAYDTMTDIDLSEDEFLRVTQGVQERTGAKASSASREAAMGINEAAAFHQERSRRSQQLDEQFEATVTSDVDQWKSSPDRYDFPGVDTPDGLDYDL